MMRINAALITAAGSSQRFGEKKEYLPFGSDASITVLSQSIYTFAKTGFFKYIAVTVPKGDIEQVTMMLHRDTRLHSLIEHNQTLFLIEGGSTRQESVYSGLLKLSALLNHDSIVLIHDGARPWVSAELIGTVYKTVAETGAAVPAIPPTDTHKEVNANGMITRHLYRNTLAAVQTPQGFIFENLLAAHTDAAADGKTYTDDSEIYAVYAGPVYTCHGDSANKKITYPGDIPVPFL